MTIPAKQLNPQIGDINMIYLLKFDVKILAEAVRFELTEGLPPRQFSRLIH